MVEHTVKIWKISLSSNEIDKTNLNPFWSWPAAAVQLLIVAAKLGQDGSKLIK
jgi:hypothetical protein